MSNHILSRFVHDNIIEQNSENKTLFEMLADFALRCDTEKRPVLTLYEKDKHKIIIAGNYVGFARLTDGTLLEILPNITESTSDKCVCDARKSLCLKLCNICDIRYSDVYAENTPDFMEYFISLFVNECMKIIKSGLLCGYASIEENLTMVQGNILFSENIRRNLVHKERMYVRHDVFTPDRAENRIIKTAAVLMMKLTASPHNSLNLKKIFSFLDDVQTLRNCEAEFSKCINTRNTKKYSTVLNICRMLLNNHENTSFSGKYVSYALFFNSDTLGFFS